MSRLGLVGMARGQSPLGRGGMARTVKAWIASVGALYEPFWETVKFCGDVGDAPNRSQQAPRQAPRLVIGKPEGLETVGREEGPGYLHPAKSRS